MSVTFVLVCDRSIFVLSLPISLLVVSLKCTCLPLVRWFRVKVFKDIGKSYLSNTSRTCLNPEDSSYYGHIIIIHLSLCSLILQPRLVAWEGESTYILLTCSSNVDKSIDLSLHGIGIPSAVNIDFKT